MEVIKKFLNEYKATFIFAIVMIAIIAVITITQVNREKVDIEPDIQDQATQLKTPTEFQDIGENYPIVTIKMKNMGNIVIKLYPNIAPNTVKNFISLIEYKFYDNSTFHRTIPDFMIQGGDPTTTGTGGPGYAIKGEFKENGFKNELSHKRGIVSMARSQDNDSGGSQFFICTADSTFLDGKYAAFGEVIEGMEIVDKIVALPVVSRDEGSAQANRPINLPIMESVTVDKKGVTYSTPEQIHEGNV